MNESAIEWMKLYFTNKENISDIVMILITIVVTYFFGIILRLFKWLFKLLRILLGKLFGILGKWLTNVKSKLVKIKEDRDYKRTIRKIERKEIPVTDKFLWKKSPEENPELRKIFQMIDDGEIEAPDSIKIRNILLSDEVFKQSPYYKSLKSMNPPTPPDIKK